MNIRKSLMRAKWLVSVVFYLFVSSKIAVAAPSDNSCTLPQGLDSKIATKFPGTHLVSLADLDDYDKKLYKDHGSRCPGLVKLDFYGDAKPTWALVLVSGADPRQLKVAFGSSSTAGSTLGYSDAGNSNRNSGRLERACGRV
jgi:hypothetical protein